MMKMTNSLKKIIIIGYECPKCGGLGVDLEHIGRCDGNNIKSIEFLGDARK